VKDVDFVTFKGVTVHDSSGAPDKDSPLRVLQRNRPRINIDPVTLNAERLQETERGERGETVAKTELHALRADEEFEKPVKVFRSLEHFALTQTLSHIVMTAALTFFCGEVFRNPPLSEDLIYNFFHIADDFI
jgi:hypothetical protein